MTDALFAPATLPSPRLALIRELGAAGLRLIPLCAVEHAHQHYSGGILKPCKTPGKVPVIPDYSSVAAGAYHEGNLPGNYGVGLGRGLLVVDVDPRNFAAGDRPLPRLVELAGGFPATFTVQTGGGGLHIYLRVPQDVLVVNGLKQFPGIEFKAAGRQVVGPGSMHQSGKEYAVVSGNPNEIAECPTALLALISRRDEPFSEVGLGRFVNDEATQARYAAWLQDEAPTSGSFKVACYGRDLGLAPAVTWQLMVEVWGPRRESPKSAEHLKERVVHAYRFASGAVGAAHPEADFKGAPPLPPLPAAPAAKEDPPAWVTTKQGAITRCYQNLITFVKLPKVALADIFAFNEFTGRVEFVRPAPWHRGRLPRYHGVSDEDLIMLRGHLAVNHGFEMGLKDIEQAVTHVAYNARFHPVRDYLTSLKWDGVPRVSFWLRDFLGVDDSEYSRACAEKVLCAAVWRIFEPGVKFDHVLVLEGRQDVGKSTAVEILAGPWHTDAPIDPHNRDTVDLLQGRWIAEMPEMEVVRRTDEEALKAFITRKTDMARLAYGRRTCEFPRQSIFIATKNPLTDGTYLKDEENRRWWPVRCEPRHGLNQIDFSGLAAARDQLFAEAVVIRAKMRHPKELSMHTIELKEAARTEAASRQVEHEWTEAVKVWLGEREKREVFDFVTAREVYLGALGGIDKQFDRKSQHGISSALRSCGWQRGHGRVGGIFMKGYRRNGAPPRALTPLSDGLFA